MKRARILLIATILAIVCVFAVAGYIDQQQRQKPVQSAMQTPQEPLNADKILELVNIERAKVGVAPLVSDPRLVASAQQKADDMVANDYFDHVNPTTGLHGYELIPKGTCYISSENIVWMKYSNTLEDSQESVDWWMDSPAHKEAMLSPKYTLTGVGIKDKRVVQHFCQQ